MPPKPTNEKVANFKSRDVDRSAIEKHQLPDDLKKLWYERNYIEFVDTAKSRISEDSALPLSESDIGSLLAILPELAVSDDALVHVSLEDFYDTCHSQTNNHKLCNNSNSFQKSIHEYVEEALYTGRGKFLPGGWAEDVRPHDHKVIANLVKAVKANAITCIKENMIPFKESDVDVEAENTLKVEVELLRKCRETPPPPEGRILLSIANKFMSIKMYKLNRWFKLDSNFPKHPGVYFLHYVGEQKLYGVVYGRDYFPIYIGMSTTDIAGRLQDHKSKIEHAKDLNIADFAVTFMIVDNKHFAPAIEGMLIEHFNPLWNKETIGFGFGVGENSFLGKVHVDKDDNSIKEIQKLLSPIISSSASEDDSEAEVDSTFSSSDSESKLHDSESSEGYSLCSGEETDDDI